MKLVFNFHGLGFFLKGVFIRFVFGVSLKAFLETFRKEIFLRKNGEKVLISTLIFIELLELTNGGLNFVNSGLTVYRFLAPVREGTHPRSH